jgi:RND family efflux transporter MFP subunit
MIFRIPSAPPEQGRGSKSIVFHGPWGLGLACLIAIAGGLVALPPATAQTAATMTAEAAPPIPVRVESLSALWRTVERSAPAQVIARNETPVTAEVSAVITKVHADVGQVVAACAPLVSLDARDYQLALEQAQAQLEAADARIGLAQNRLERARRMREKQFVSPDELNQIETELKLARAERRTAETSRAQAQRNVDKCVIRAPYRAVVTARTAQIGQLATSGTPLLNLVEMDSPEVSARLEDSQANGLEHAQEPRLVTLQGTFPLRLQRISPVLERGSRAREARLVFAATPAPIGAEGRLEWREPQAVLPPDLLVRREGKLGVFTAEDQQARFLTVDNAQEGRPFALQLPEETLLVTEGQQRLNTGARLQIRP